MNFQQFKSKWHETIYTSGRYSLIGFLCFLLDLLLLLVLVKYTNIHYLIASVISYVIGSTINYGFSISWIFKKRKLRDYWKTELLIFMLIELFALCIMSGSLYVFKEFLRFPLKYSKIIANILAALWNYTFKYYFLFRRDPEMSKKRFPE